MRAVENMLGASAHCLLRPNNWQSALTREVCTPRSENLATILLPHHSLSVSCVISVITNCPVLGLKSCGLCLFRTKKAMFTLAIGLITSGCNFFAQVKAMKKLKKATNFTALWVSKTCLESRVKNVCTNFPFCSCHAPDLGLDPTELYKSNSQSPWG